MLTAYKNIRAGVLLVLLSLSLVVFAEDMAENSAFQRVATTTSAMQGVLEEAPDYIDEDPERYFRAVHEVLDPVIDYKGFARGVMGAYASSERYRSLDSAGKKQLRAQLNRFTEIIKETLVKTYGKGLLAFGGSRIETLPTDEKDARKRVVSVVQHVYGDDDKPRVVNYQMAQNKKGQWRLRNVIIEAVNLGKVYRNQFESAARQHDGDLNAVIANWQDSADK